MPDNTAFFYQGKNRCGIMIKWFAISEHIQDNISIKENRTHIRYFPNKYVV